MECIQSGGAAGFRVSLLPSSSPISPGSLGSLCLVLPSLPHCLRLVSVVTGVEGFLCASEYYPEESIGSRHLESEVIVGSGSSLITLGSGRKPGLGIEALSSLPQPHYPAELLRTLA